MNKKVAFILLINLILFFLMAIMIIVVNNNKGGASDNSNVQQHIEELNTELSDIKIQMDQWNSLINGDTSIDINVEGEKEDKKEKEEAPEDDEKQEDDAVEDEPESEEVEEDEEKEEEPKEVTKTSNASNLNVRATPSTNANVVGTLNNGNKVKTDGETKDADGHTWMKVTLSNGNTGWVVESYLD